MQGLNKRFYYHFCPSMVKKINLYDLGNMSCGLIAFPSQNHLNMLEPSRKEDSLCQWKKVKYDTLLSELQKKQEIIIEVN